MKILMVLLAISSLILIITILLQSSNSDGMSGAIADGAEQLFRKKKNTGYEAILKKVSVVVAVLFIVLSLAIVTLQSRGF